MNGFVTNIEKESLENENFRTVLYTDNRLQLVVMNLKPNEDIGEEVHTLDQFIRVEKGEGKSVLDGEEKALADGFAVIIPAGARHNIVNTSSVNPLKLYTLYAPPNHREGTVHKTKADAIADEGEHFVPKTQEFD
ncbi:MAG: cupin domain-containing protein [Patescibacteria group bacterium]